ncbi:hypothetical protein BVX95_02155 [archaeon D22]|nr:hypothetical protein BVX95_02155 [archaeon D22]
MIIVDRRDEDSLVKIFNDYRILVDKGMMSPSVLEGFQDLDNLKGYTDSGNVKLLYKKDQNGNYGGLMLFEMLFMTPQSKLLEYFKNFRECSEIFDSNEIVQHPTFFEIGFSNEGLVAQIHLIESFSKGTGFEMFNWLKKQQINGIFLHSLESAVDSYLSWGMKHTGYYFRNENEPILVYHN